jgi:hypothetical protein
MRSPEIKRSLALRALVSNAAWLRLYEARRARLPAAGVRHRYAVWTCATLLVIAVSLLLATAWVPNDVASYLESRTNIRNADESELSWEATSLTSLECLTAEDCLARLRGAARQKLDLATLDRIVNAGPGSRHMLVRLRIAPAAFAVLGDDPATVVALPSFNYLRADVYRDGAFLGTFRRGARVLTTLDSDGLKSAGATFEVVFEVLASTRTFAGQRNAEGVLVATPGEYERYRDFVGMRNANASGVLGDLAKVVVGLFCLLLYLIVDSSPESLGLALFMGFEGAAMGIGHGWMPFGLVGMSHLSALTNFCFQMGDLLKIYFLLQMARVGRASALPWLLVSAGLSVPYGFFMEWAGQNNLTWTYRIPLSRDNLTAVVGLVFCGRALLSLRGQSLPWRKTALLIAMIAAAFEGVDSWIAHSDAIRINPNVLTLFTVLQANTGYLFALSTFLNISTLENRVQSLTAAKARAEQMERELEIGQIVQRALLKPPELPTDVDLMCHYEAALYVSGDTYYTHWDKQRQLVTFLVNDVTGHGVQAALKASACNVLAKTIWELDHSSRFSFGDGARLAELDRMTQAMLVEMNAVPDFSSLCGAEFDLRGGRLAVYRSNFTFPVLVSPVVPLRDGMEPFLGELWRVEAVVCRNQEVAVRQLVRGGFVLIMSDGFLESSRDMKRFSSYLREALATRDAGLTAGAIGELVMRYEPVDTRPVDDRTLMVFQWRPGAREVPLPVDENPERLGAAS